jgi:hypothetical protein
MNQARWLSNHLTTYRLSPGAKMRFVTDRSSGSEACSIQSLTTGMVAPGVCVRASSDTPDLRFLLRFQTPDLPPQTSYVTALETGKEAVRGAISLTN